MEPARSPVHRIVSMLEAAVRALGAAPDALAVERWGFAVHAALSSANRNFHNHDHALAVAAASDGEPIDVIAALYHDVVYVQVDRGPPPAMAAELARAFVTVDGGWQVLPPPTPAVADVLALFGRAPGDVVGPYGGSNELASAVVAALHLGDAVARWPLATVAMAIEQTIPFRDDPAPALNARAAALGAPADSLPAMVRQAVRFGNHDVLNFAADDPGRFLDNTWKLLPETNPSLHAPSVYTVRDYRVALEKTEGFLATLAAERVFHAWGGEPSPALHAARVAQAARNLALAVRYLRAKLYSIAVVEALCEATGGTVPLDYFMGGIASPGDEAPERIEHHLPSLPAVAGLEPVLHALLAVGRASPSSFDTGPSPLAAYLHATCGEDAIARGLAAARAMWAGGAADAFLAAQPGRAIAGIARAAALVVPTRSATLRALADRLAG